MHFLKKTWTLLWKNRLQGTIIFLQGLYTHLVSADTGPLLSRFFRYFFIDFARWKPLQETLLLCQPAKIKKKKSLLMKNNIICKKTNVKCFRGSTALFPRISKFSKTFAFTGNLFSENIVMLKKIETKFYLTLQSGEISFQIFQDNDNLRYLLRMNNLYLSACLSTWLSISIFEQNVCRIKRDVRTNSWFRSKKDEKCPRFFVPADSLAACWVACCTSYHLGLEFKVID